ncbi:uncharacterized protein EAF01_011057 [Botrytis porri]|uniref:Uncharacterized protein n=1 Tax=Botrytis porri TaxID=87229 RepID=A0A4Z1KNL7_9HELO|nr:uncharacterized protein EAF01_011057 [Botrytis porri]KAF7887903.1 hypothetical protein EAF01_011057 [Botrytis porri]TGO87693.1 hypothetical protein BPOR_0209g00010 [Botrytis porri]
MTQSVFTGDDTTYPTQKQIRQIVDENFEAKSAYLDGLNPKKISEKPDSTARKQLRHIPSSIHPVKTITNAPLEKFNFALEFGTTTCESKDGDSGSPQESRTTNERNGNISTNRFIKTDGAVVAFQPPHEIDKSCRGGTENAATDAGELFDVQSVQEQKCKAYSHNLEGTADTDQILSASNSCRDKDEVLGSNRQISDEVQNNTQKFEISISPVIKKSFKRCRRNSEPDFGQLRSKRARSEEHGQYLTKLFASSREEIHSKSTFPRSWWLPTAYERLMSQPDTKICDPETQCIILKEANEALTTACYEWCARHHPTRLREMKWLRRSRAQLHLFYRNVVQWEISMSTLILLGNQRTSTFLSLLNVVAQIRHCDIHDDKELPIQLLDIMLEDAVSLAIMVRDPKHTQKLRDIRDHVRLEDPTFFLMMLLNLMMFDPVFAPNMGG